MVDGCIRGRGSCRLTLPPFQAAFSKLADLPHPQLDVDAWVRFACSCKRTWRTLFLAKWRSSLSAAYDQPLTVECSVCGKPASKQGLGAHMESAHRHFRRARMFCNADGICPVCGDNISSRLRCMHHVHYSRPACLLALMNGLDAPLPADLVLALDASDATVRRQAHHTGQSFLSL